MNLRGFQSLAQVALPLRGFQPRTPGVLFKRLKSTQKIAGLRLERVTF